MTPSVETLVEGERSHHCANPAPHVHDYIHIPCSPRSQLYCNINQNHNDKELLSTYSCTSKAQWYDHDKSVIIKTECDSLDH